MWFCLLSNVNVACTTERSTAHSDGTDFSCEEFTRLLKNFIFVLIFVTKGKF